MENNLSANEQEERRRKKDKLEKQMKELKDAHEKLGGRLSHLQSSAFQLANYYFVFQGVILTALCNKNTALKCSDRWFLATLSLLAAVLNLVALLLIGSKYNQMMNQQAITWSICNKLQCKLSALEEDEQVPSQNRQPSRTSSELSTTDQPAVLMSSRTEHDRDYVDTSERMKRNIVLVLCMLIFVSFAIIVFVGCLTILCTEQRNSHSS